MKPPNSERNSLRRRVLRWLLVPLALVSLVILVEVYYSANSSTKSIQERMLVSQAIGIAQYAIRTGGDLVHLELVQQMSGGLNFYRVQGPRNSYITGYGGLPLPPPGRALRENTPYFYSARYRGGEIRMVALRIRAEDDDDVFVTVYVGQLADLRRRLVWERLKNSTIRLGLLIALAAALSWFAVTRGLSPLAALERAIARRSPDDTEPIRTEAPAEVRNVVDALNHLLLRLQQGIERKKRFIANAAHQLRTPISSLMAQSELALRRTDGGRRREDLKNINARAAQMSRLVGQLLSLARAESEESTESSFKAIDIVSFVKQKTVDWLNNHRDAKIDVGFDSSSESVCVMGNETLLAELFNNLLDNSNNYCADACAVDIRLRETATHVLIDIEDNGPGILESEFAHVTERFFRLREDKIGSGLGLSIAAEVARRHRGDMRLSTPKGHSGLSVRLTFPLAAVGANSEAKAR